MMISVIIFALFITKVTLIVTQCSTVETIGGTETPEECIFPFKYKNQTFHDCTTFDESDDKEWCSVETDSQGDHMFDLRRWGYCDQIKCSQDSNTNEAQKKQCLTVCKCIFKYDRLCM